MKFSELFVALGLKDENFRKGLKGAQTQTSAFAKSIKSLGGIIAGAFAVNSIINFGKQSAIAADQELKSQAKLLQALDGRKDIQEDLLKQASDLQKTTLYGDETTVEAQSRLATLGMESEQIKKLIPLIQDLATVKGMDLVSAAELVAKSVMTSTNALQRQGITIEGTAGSVERFNSLFDQLNEKVSGQAVIAAQTGIGAWQQLNNAFGDLQETIGKLLIESEKGGIAGWLTENVNYWNYALNKVQEDGNTFIAWWKWFWSSYEDDFYSAEQMRQNVKDWADDMPSGGVGQQLDWTGATEEETKKILAAREAAAKKLEEQVEKQKQINNEVATEIEQQYSKNTLLEQINEHLSIQAQKAEELAAAQNEIFSYDEEKEAAFEYIDVNDKVQKSNYDTSDSFRRLGDAVGDLALAWAGSNDKTIASLARMVAQMIPIITEYVAVMTGASIAAATAGAAEAGASTGPAAPITTPIFLAELLAIVLGALATIDFATGGIVPGTSFHGDNVIIGANSGEMILNGGQQRNLFEMINAGISGQKDFTFRIYGSDLFTVNNFETRRRSGMR